MVRILVCESCKREAERTNHLDLYSTYRSIIFGCEHSIAQLKRDVEEQVELARAVGKRGEDFELIPRIVKHSKVAFKQGRFLIKDEKATAASEGSE